MVRPALCTKSIENEELCSVRPSPPRRRATERERGARRAPREEEKSGLSGPSESSGGGIRTHNTRLTAECLPLNYPGPRASAEALVKSIGKRRDEQRARPPPSRDSSRTAVRTCGPRPAPRRAIGLRPGGSARTTSRPARRWWNWRAPMYASNPQSRAIATRLVHEDLLDAATPRATASRCSAAAIPPHARAYELVHPWIEHSRTSPPASGRPGASTGIGLQPVCPEPMLDGGRAPVQAAAIWRIESRSSTSSVRISRSIGPRAA